VDCETSYVRLGLAEDLANHLGAPAVRLSELRADALTRLVKSGTELGAA
jgi:magnesium chelatase subunit D